MKFLHDDKPKVKKDAEASRGLLVFSKIELVQSGNIIHWDRD